MQMRYLFPTQRSICKYDLFSEDFLDYVSGLGTPCLLFGSALCERGVLVCISLQREFNGAKSSSNLNAAFGRGSTQVRPR